MKKAAVRFLSPTRRYAELDESAIVAPPSRPASVLQREHFNVAPSHLKYPASLDFSHENFKLRSLALLQQVKETALQEILLSDNELHVDTGNQRHIMLSYQWSHQMHIKRVDASLRDRGYLTWFDLTNSAWHSLIPTRVC